MSNRHIFAMESYSPKGLYNLYPLVNIPEHCLIRSLPRHFTAKNQFLGIETKPVFGGKMASSCLTHGIIYTGYNTAKILNLLVG